MAENSTENASGGAATDASGWTLESFLKEKFNLDLKKAAELFKKTTEYWRKLTGSYVYPNGMLGELPVYITEMSFAKSNSISSNALYYGDEVVDNIVKEAYEVNLELICFGKEYLNEIKNLRNLSEDKSGEENIISFAYRKNSTIYYPLIITNVSYSDSADSTMLQTVSIKLKQINLTSFSEADKEITCVLKKSESYSNGGLFETELPKNLYEELRKEIPKFKEGTDAIKNIFKLS